MEIPSPTKKPRRRIDFRAFLDVLLFGSIKKSTNLLWIPRWNLYVFPYCYLDMFRAEFTN